MPAGERADMRQPPADVWLYPSRCVSLQPVRKLGASGRCLFLLHHAVHHRLRRLCPRNQPRFVAVAEERRVWPVPRVRSRSDRHVLQPHAGGGAQ